MEYHIRTFGTTTREYTQVLVGNKLDGLSDLHEGTHVKVAYVRWAICA